MTRLFGGFVLVVVFVLALGGTATAQRKQALGADGVTPLNFNAGSLNTPLLFVDAEGSRVCGVTAIGPVTVSCFALPFTIAAGTPVVALNPFDTGFRLFVVGTGVGTTLVCAVTSSPTVGTTVCSTSPF